jgi:O-methyltransferase
MSWKTIFKAVFRRTGYEICKIQAGKEYTLLLPYGCHTYSPWYEDWFREIYDKVKDHTGIAEDRCYMLHRLSQHCSHLDGDFAECGVYKGGSAFLIALTLEQIGTPYKELHIFDTFKGMPDFADQDPSCHVEGHMGDISLDAIRDYLRVFPFIVFHPGVIPETFEAVKEKRFAFVHVDVDLYRSTRDCCAFFYDGLVRGGMMVIDDYGFPGYKLAAKRAVDEFFHGKPENPIALRTGQCIVIKL